MKKIILFFAAVLLSYGLHAQDQKFVLSTHVSFLKDTYLSRLEGTQINYRAKDRRTNLTPRFAYRINKMWSVGVSYSYFKATTTQINTVSFGTEQPNYVETDLHSKNQQFGAFVQSYLYDNGKFAVFLEGAANHGKHTIDVQSDYSTIINFSNDNTKNFNVGIHSGIRYNFWKGLGAEARLNNLINYSHVYGKDEIFDMKSVVSLQDVLGSASIGVSFSF